MCGTYSGGSLGSRLRDAVVYQGRAVAEPGGPWCLTFALWQLENLRFFIQIICWHPTFYSFRALGTLQFSLEPNLVYYLGKYTLFTKFSA